MRKLFLLVMAGMLFTACQQAEQRYFAESDQTKILEKGIAAYESGDWDTWRSHFADTAKIYVNSGTPISLDQRVEDLSAMTAGMASYGFDKSNAHIEMVLDKEEETWVYYWATHQGTFAATGKDMDIEVHLAVQFVGDKIVAEHIFFDATAMNAEFAAIANMSEADMNVMESMNNLKDAWVNNNSELFNAYAHENLVRSVNGVEEVKGLDNYLAMVQGNHDMLSDISIVLNDVNIQGNEAHIKWTFSGKHTKDTEAQKATNKDISMNGYGIWTFDSSGKATHEAVYFNPTALSLQMGFTLSPPAE